MEKYDVIIIGSGPAGEASSMLLSKSNQKTLIIEQYKEVGGKCTHWGTIPSKAIRHIITSYLNLKKLPISKPIKINLPVYTELLDSAKIIINKQVEMRKGFYTRNHVNIIFGEASFEKKNIIKVKHSNKLHKFYEAKSIIIATGSIPHRPTGIDFNHPKILDSDKILQLKENPNLLLIYGSGIIGVEYACIFKNLGTKINLINSRERVLDFLDQEITDALNFKMRDMGIVIRNQEEFSSLEEKKNKLIMNFKSGKKIKTDYILWAQGRSGNTKNLNLEKIGIETQQNNYIKVDENYQTNIKGIYSIGDVIGWPSLASAAYDQGRYVASLLIGKPINKSILSFYPTGIYTTPEISHIGENETQLTRKKIPYEVGIAHYKNLAKAQILGDETGILKLLFHRKTLEILGIHCFGRQASEIIHIGQAIMKQKNNNSIEYFINTSFNYPTMAEAYRIAALNGLNRL